LRSLSANEENRVTEPKITRLSLRSKGIAVLAVPMTALFVGLFSIYQIEENARKADLEVVRAYDVRSELLRLQVALLDHSDVSIRSSILRLKELAGPEAAPIENALGGPETDILSRMAVLNQEQDLRLFRAQYNRDAARQRLFRIVMVAGIIGPLGGLFMHLIIAGRLVKRLQGVQENARRLAHGLPLEPLNKSFDEIGTLSQQLEDAAFLMRGRERELRESEGRYRDLFDRAPIPYEETDAEGRIRRFNQEVCNLLRCTPDRILGRCAWDFVAPDQHEMFRAAMLERLAKGAETGPLECDYVLEDGTTVRIEVRESLIRNDAGEVTGICRSLLDVTERNLATVAARKVAQYAMELRNKNEQLAHALDAARSATEAKSRFLASVSHELRTPLNGIIGFSELMYDGKLGPIQEEQREIMGDILTSARHLLQLISDILDLSKVEAGKMEFHPEHGRIDMLVHEVRDVVRPLAERKNLSVETSVPDGLTAVLDRSRLKQVLYNFLSNAVKFTPSGGHVQMRVDLDEKQGLRVEVEDNGYGIPPEEMALLFKEFQQLPNSRRAEQGTGLGLALTRLIVEAQGGTVGVRSSLGKGSTFSAILPINCEAESAVR
jgi:PAS domain S-box-containing protein